MPEADLIVSNPQIMIGKPIIRGTRITVELILAEFAAGYSEEDILDAHPHVTRDGIRAALAFAAQVLAGRADCPIVSQVNSGGAGDKGEQGDGFDVASADSWGD